MALKRPKYGYPDRKPLSSENNGVSEMEIDIKIVKLGFPKWR